MNKRRYAAVTRRASRLAQEESMPAPIARPARLLLSSALVAGTLLGASPGFAQSARQPVVVLSGPREAPPPLREERHENRRGYIWVKGRWAWQNNAWVWSGGRWEAERPTSRYVEGRWELRGNHWEWIEGGWAEIPKFPPLDQPPPPPQREDDRVDPGYVFLPGRWVWKDGAYVWQKGARARAEPGMYFEPGQWIQRDGHWLWTNGGWQRGVRSPPIYNPNRPPVVTGPSSAPPPPRDERPERRPGYVWARGHHDWRNGQYEWVPGHWEPQRARLTWTDGRWEQRNNTWIYVEGGWR
jgi:hypothetical protein